MSTRFIRGKSIHYSEVGTGRPLVLVHAFPVDSRMWAGQVESLAAQCRVIAVDLPGFGESQEAGAFTLLSMAQVVHDLLKEIGALPCVFAGISMGGYIALAFAREFAGDLQGLVLIDTKAEGDTAQQKEGRQKMIDLVRQQGAKGVAGQMMPKMLAVETPNRRPDVAQKLQTMMEACPAMTIERALLAMRDRPDRSSDLASIAVRTLVIVGDKDSITLVATAESMRSLIPNATLAVIGGAGHMSPMEQPAQVNRAISQFLKLLPAPS